VVVGCLRWWLVVWGGRWSFEVVLVSGSGWWYRGSGGVRLAAGGLWC
jgi:hypothetical protein